MSLTLAVESISLEAGLFANTINTAKNLLPSVLSGLKKAFNSTSELPELEQVNTKLQDNVLKNIEGVSFTDLDKLEILVPEGFSSDFLTASAVIDTSIDFINDAVNETLKNYRVYLSVFLSNKDAKISIKDNSSFNKSAANKRTAINNLYSGLYNTDSYNTKSFYTKVVRRNGDLKDVFTSYNKIGTKLKAIDIKNVKTQIDNISDLLETIIEQIENNKIDNISPEALTNLSNGAFEMAMQMETVSACYFRALTLCNSVDAMTEKLDKRLKP